MVGQQYFIFNTGTGTVTIQSSGANNVQALIGGSSCAVTCILASGTTAASWNSQYIPPVGNNAVGNAVTTDASQTLTNKTFTTPVLAGIPTGTGVATTSTANTLALRDANGNISAINEIEGYTTTTTVGGTTTLTVSSTYQQYFTGTLAQTVLLPVASTLALGQQFQIVNNSTGIITVQSSGANNILTLQSGSACTVTCILISGTTAASWSASASGATINSVGSTMLSGTYANVQTYSPAASAMATLDFSKGNIHRITMPSSGNITIVFSNTTSGQCVLIDIIQGSGGSGLVTWPTIKWASGGVAPTLTITASKTDSIGIEVTTAGSVYQGYVIGQNL